ncbi:hypothetical protein Acor_79630 [Acrocarpospora corrugata]|uniref:Uncharacterized protein n=1 Tax=Acrocarpospora corrugata TaxID=35763 RepID=A0A5M3WAF8_9ACTN|nr:hypothetical protein Acor_79630 [Acrocarpospora corrugata]
MNAASTATTIPRASRGNGACDNTLPPPLTEASLGDVTGAPGSRDQPQSAS